MKSRLYEGRVWHRRNDPAYTFVYTVWYLALDLAEIATLDRRLRLFSRNRFNVVSLHDGDYIGLESQNAGDLDGRVELVTMPRFLGYVFNPVSFFIHRASDGQIRHVAAEVHNTWGERHIYDLRRQDPDNGYQSGVDKAFYVSPFIDLEGRYRFEINEDGDGRLRIRIEESDGDDWFFGAGIDVKPKPLTDSGILRMLVRYPFVNLKTILMIHWQGLRIWRRGARFRPNPSRRKEHGQPATGER